MDWDAYKQIYVDFEIAINQGKIITQASSNVLKNYPHDLPTKDKKEIDEGIKDLIGTLREVAKASKPTPSKDAKQNVLEKPPKIQTEISDPTLMIAIYNVLSKRKPFDIDFSKVIYSQQLAMAFAHFDAFLGDTIRIILRVNPNILRKNKQITWDVLIDLGSWDAVVEHLSESFVYDFGWLSATERLTFFYEKFGFDLELNNNDKEAITEGELLRHLIIHNGGRVSVEHIKRTQNKTLKVGELLPIDHALLDKVCFALRKASSNLFIRVSESFFKKPENEITGIPRFSSIRQGA